jgi:hypothetical protein
MVSPSRRVNVLGDGLSVAGFQVIMSGRFWVFTEDPDDPLESLYQLLRDETMEGQLPMSVPEQTVKLKTFSIRLYVFECSRFPDCSHW